MRTNIDQMIEGASWLPPIGLSRTTVFAAIRSLREKGAVVVQRIKRGLNRYTVNVGWALGMKQPKKAKTERKALAEPRNRRSDLSPEYGLNDEVESVFCTPQNKSCTTYEENTSSAPSAPDVPSSGVEVVKRITEASRKQQNQSDDIVDVWRSAWAEGFPGEGTPGLGKKGRGQLKHVLARFPEGRQILHWAVANWSGIMGRKFSWRKKPVPVRPDPGFILTYVLLFAGDYAEQKDRTTYWQLPGEEREYASLCRRGMTHDEAMIAIGLSRAKREDRSGKSALLEQIKREAQVLEEARRRLREEIRAGRVAAAPAPPTAPARPKIDHGSNPYENGGGEMADFSNLGEWDGGE